MENRTSARIAALYLRRVRLSLTPEYVRRVGRENGRISWVLNSVNRAIEPLGGEKFLMDSVFNWILEKCNTKQSIECYATTFARWAKDTNRLSLSSQIAANDRSIFEFLREIESAGLSYRYISRFRDVLRSWYRWLESYGLLRKNPISLAIVKSYRVDQGRIRRGCGMRQALTADEAKMVARWALTFASPAMGLAVMLQMVCGLRSHEVAALKKSDLVEMKGAIVLMVRGKGNKSRQVFMEKSVKESYRRYFHQKPWEGERGPLLVSRKGGHFTAKTIQFWAKKAALVAGRMRDISSHDLRRTAITLLMERGARVEDVQAFAGHSSPVLTLRCYVTRRPKMNVTTGIPGIEEEESAYVSQ